MSINTDWRWWRMNLLSETQIGYTSLGQLVIWPGRHKVKMVKHIRVAFKRARRFRAVYKVC